MNDKLIGDVVMDNPILNLGNEFMYIGTFSEKEKIEFDLTIIDIEIDEYHLGTNDYELIGGTINSDKMISHRTSIPKPIRREGLYRELYHDSNSSINKSWVHKETRNNQIFFNNFVKQNLIDFTKEGLNTTPEGFMPWFDVPDRQTKNNIVAFGHWSALGWLNRSDVWCLDSGCVWGRTLTALKVNPSDQSFEKIEVSCADQITIAA
jgi:hypothetical protein